MSVSRAAQINLAHHTVLSCSRRLQELVKVFYGDGASSGDVVPVCQSLLQPYVKALEIPPDLWDAFALPTDDEVRICGEKGRDAHAAVLALTGGTLALVAMVVCSSPHEGGDARSDDRGQKRFTSRVIEIMMPRVLAHFSDLSEDLRKEKEREPDAPLDKAVDGPVRIRQEHRLRKTMDVLGDALVAECPEVLEAGKAALYSCFFNCFDEVFPHMEDDHIPALRERLCFIRSQELLEVKSRLRRELLFARENVDTETAGQARPAKSKTPTEGRTIPVPAGAEAPSAPLPDDDGVQDWPPKVGWGFVAGKASFDGKVIPVKGIQWSLLKALSEARYPQTVDDLRRAGWAHDSLVDENTVRTHLSSLRTKLRESLSLEKGFNPISCVDRGKNAAWELHSGLRPKR